MQINGKEYNVDDLISENIGDMHNNYHGIYLTNKQCETLKDYGFDYMQYNNIKELIFDLNNYLLNELVEFDYYHNFNK